MPRRTGFVWDKVLKRLVDCQCCCKEEREMREGIPVLMTERVKGGQDRGRVAKHTTSTSKTDNRQ